MTEPTLPPASHPAASATAGLWRDRADALLAEGRLDGRAFIGGQRVAAVDGQTFACHSPIDGRKLLDVTRGQQADVDAAVRAARQAFEDGRWSRKAPAVRKRILLRFAELITQHKDELALLETLDMGKPIQYSLSVDVPAAARCIAWYAEAIDKVYDEIAPTPANALALIQREPVGVVGAIVPWNYPMIMAAWKLGPALACGNSVVLKPSEKSPLTALRLAELALKAGVPEGVFNVVPGYGHEAGEALALHMDVDALGFTGSTRVGRKMLEYAGRSNLKRVFNELGGKSAVLLFDDFDDLDRAAATVAGSLFFNQGESCNAPSRLLVHASIADAVVERIVALTPKFQPADPLSTGTVMGALVDEGQLNTVLRYIEQGNAQGARLLAGGRQARADTGGFYVEPTVFDGVRNDMTIAQEEIFGPVLSVVRFEDEAQAVSLANASSYGLQASVWSRSLDRAHRVARALRAGTVHVNQYDDDDITVPFGGVKQSGNGRDKSLHALEKYTELKTTWIRLDGA
ncbi:aldehyde dehydrogenase [uncultured Aquabacterium sp.]|uniref:aldehyde dehydrogenase n=1 Tax=uncultured Aquabacterium sp. TaxID=158753 RepID=UPI0025D294FC|nr:aldehyde dehydrogenase [uncultured Aquabacterium sp.]